MARYLLEYNNDDYAFQILQDGLAYRYRQLSPAYLQLLELTSVVASKMGNAELANDLAGLLKQYRQDYEAMLTEKRRDRIINPY